MADPLALDEALHALAERALALGSGVDAHERADGSAAARAGRRALVVRALLNERSARPLRLADAAAAAGCSASRIAKDFRRATGQSIHATLVRLRLRHALEALRQGDDDLTRLALAVGFASHSHFSAAFRAEFGVTPRAARSALGAFAPTAIRAAAAPRAS
jgi:AraC-like DNA-binding protein